MPHVFAPPVAAHRARLTVPSHSSTNTKRKKQKIAREAVQSEDESDNASDDAKLEGRGNVEYTAVVTPQERHQRRVAGQPLDQAPPPPPFPHAADPSTKLNAIRQALLAKKSGSNTSPAPESSQSLHVQHIAALTTIVYRSLLQEDFTRASRALGLLFREDAVSDNAAIRKQGFMGIAAEVLLRSGCSRDPLSSSASVSLPFTHGGFEKAKRLYERLIVQHPYHKSWPDTVNAVDFYLAMFNLWIYVVHAENAHTSDKNEDIEMDADGDRKVRELEQASRIASRLDTCMATVPYMDERELIRLCAMVALWKADLHEDCALLVNTYGSPVSDAPHRPEGIVGSIGQKQSTLENEHLQKANLARDKARELFSKLEGQATSDAG